MNTSNKGILEIFLAILLFPINWVKKNPSRSFNMSVAMLVTALVFAGISGVASKDLAFLSILVVAFALLKYT